MSTANGAKTGASSGQNGASSKTKHVMPSLRIKEGKALEVLIGYAKLSGADRDAVTNKLVAEALGVSPTNTSTANPFFVDIGLLIKGKDGFIPANEVYEFNQRLEWNDADAAHKLRPIIEKTWFSGAVIHKLKLRDMPEDDVIKDLAEAADAGPSCEQQLKTLLFFMEAAGMIVRQNGAVSIVRDSREISPLADVGDQQREVDESDNKPSDPSKIAQDVQPGMMSIPIPTAENPKRVMTVPNDLDEDDCEMINQMLGAIAKRLLKTRT